MVRTYTLPPVERLDIIKPGENKKGEQLLNIYNQNEINDFIKKVGPLEKKDFSYLIDWMFLMTPDSDYGLAYRVGMKDNFIGPTGNLGTLAIHFGNPIAKAGLPITPEIEDIQFGRLGRLVKLMTMKSQLLYENFTSLTLAPPPWMMNELNEMIRKNNEVYKNRFGK